MSDTTDNLPAADGGRHPCEESSLSPDDCLFHIREWLQGKLESGPTETKGHADRSGHPHFWAAVLFPDWDVKQKIADIDAARQGTRPFPGAGYLEVGHNDQGEIVVNHPDLKRDENGVGHIVFSVEQARNLARLLLKRADMLESLAQAGRLPGAAGNE